MRYILALLLFLAAVSSAQADITIRNFNGAGTGTIDAVTMHDDGNNAVDAHDGMILQVGGTFYLYGTSYGCGFIWQTASPFCGFQVYSSTDLGFNKKWHLEGKLFDATTTAWQNKCAGVATGSGGGCFELRVIFNPTNSTYVFWFNQPGGTPTAADAEQVFTCTTPTCGATTTVPGTPTFQTPPSLLVHGPVSSSEALFVDTDNSCYLLYNNPVGARENYIDKLNSTCTDSAGTSVDTNLQGEGDALFLANGTYYAMSGSLCAYCSGGATTVYSSASSIMGAYSLSTQISTISCNGQLQSVNTIVAGGSTTYLYAADQWQGTKNEGYATIYYKPLSFTSGAINSLTCDTTVTVPGITPDPNPSVAPYPYPYQDQSSVAIGYHDTCDTASAFYRMQTFVPTQATLAAIYMPLAVGEGNNGNLTVSLVTVDASNNPVSTLASVTYAPANLNYATTWTTLPLHATLTPSATYGIELTSTATAGCNTVPAFFGSFTDPYPGGVERFSTDGGSTWTTETSRALMFSTQQPNTSPAGRHFP